MSEASLIFHVEDDEGDARTVARGFAKTGCGAQILRASDGRMACAILKDFATGTQSMPDLMLLDMKLPYVSGVEVLKAARSMPELANLPIVVLTSSDGEADRRMARENGCTEYLVKPMDYASFVALVGDVCRRYLPERVAGEPGADMGS